MVAAEFTPPRLIEFQLDGAALACVRRHMLAAWDTGTGKSGLALGAACMALQDGTDIVIIVCEPNKIAEWVADLGIFTTIRPEDIAVYHGPRRSGLLASLPAVLITTYDIIRQDGALVAGPRKMTDGPLLDALAGLDVMVVYDEISILGNRGSRRYRAHHHFLERLRARGSTRRLGLTATPVETGYENLFSELRLIVPQAMPMIKEFDKKVIAYRDPTRYYQAHYRPEGITWFREICAPWILRKRKTDPDVVEQFPPFTEKFILCPLHADQKALYRRLEDLAWDESGSYQKVAGLAPLLRQLAGDPLAVREAAAHGDSALACIMWEEMEPELKGCSSGKAEELVRQLEFICGNGHKAIVFTFFAHTVLPALAERLAGFSVFTYHGGMARGVQEQAKAGFLAAPGAAVLLASDAAARGINLPGIPYVIEYEAARTHAIRTQRAGRAHRLGSGVPVTMITLVAEGTMEDARAIPRLLDRNEQQDVILGDSGAENYVTADDRREMFARARRRKLS